MHMCCCDRIFVIENLARRRNGTEYKTFVLSGTQLTHPLKDTRLFKNRREIETPLSKHAIVTDRNVTQQCSRHHSSPLPVCEIISQVCWPANDATCLGHGRVMSQSFILSSQLRATSMVPRVECWRMRVKT